MASIKNSLRKIYTALGGTNTKSKTITGLLDDISTVASGGSGGNERFIITFTQSGDTWSADKTLTEISNAWSDGKEIFGAKSGMGGTIFLPLAEIQDRFQVSFSRTTASGSSMVIETLTINAMQGVKYKSVSIS